MNQNLLTSMKQVLSQKRLPKEILVEAIEAALLQAAKRRYGSVQSVKVELNETTGEIQVFAPKRVVEIMRSFATEIPIEEALKTEPEAKIGDVIEVPVETRDFGRIEAQLARQILVQKIKDAERMNIFNLYKDRVEEIVSGVVQQQDYRDVILEIEGAEAVLPWNEQLRNESYERGDRIRALVIDVMDPENAEHATRRFKAPVILSRAHPVLLVRLFEQEVPEIVDGLVNIMAIAREPGERSKIAVASTEDGIDAVGTCVGVRGSRVQMVVRELSGERIDVLPWSPDPAEFIANALGQTKVSEVILGEDEGGEPLATVVVPEEQLSLAIGRRGQNARLANRLTGWKIDIVSEREVSSDLRSRMVAEIFKTDSESEPVEEVPELPAAELPPERLVGVGPKVAATLREHGYANVGAIAEADVKELSVLPNLGAKTAEKLVASAKSLILAEQRAAAASES
ncbi:transcription termination/antitermination protein NusA [Candidatus Poribacteria bacterium]|nr:transcription termination/antitermination protein NusA [Candidatus Poribacteria bacterium]